MIINSTKTRGSSKQLSVFMSMWGSTYILSIYFAISLLNGWLIFMKGKEMFAFARMDITIYTDSWRIRKNRKTVSKTAGRSS